MNSANRSEQLSSGEGATSARVTESSTSERPLFWITDEASHGAPAGAFDGAVPLRVTRAIAEARRTVQGMAASLIGELRAEQPGGPYRLGGSGPFGVLAYEVAVQLLGADEQVEFLGLHEATCADWDTRFRARSERRRSANGVSTDPRARVEAAVLDYDVPRSPLRLNLFTRAPGEGRGSYGWDLVVPREHIHFDVLGDARAIAPRAHPDPKGARDVAALMTIQAGSRSSEPTFCFPGAGASAADFVSLAGALGEAARVHAFQPRGMNPELVPHSTVEAAAEAYLRELGHQARSGPVKLVGHSFGGWVAFEVALRLAASGRRIGALVLVDSECPGSGGRLSCEYTRPEALMQLVGLYEQAVERSLGLSLSDFETREPSGQLQCLHERLVSVGLVPARSEPAMLAGSVRSFETALRTHYLPRQPFLGPVKLILVPMVGEAADVAERRFQKVVAGWRAFAPELRFVRGSGNHVTVLRQPHASVVARCVDEGASGGEGREGVHGHRLPTAGATMALKASSGSA